MNKISDEEKRHFGDITKESLIKYGKIAGSCVVVLMMCIVCIVSSISRLQDKKNQSVGIMMTLSDVASGKTAFAGNTFEVASVSYQGMKNANVESEQLAQLEKSEKQIDDILASKREERRGLSSKNALNSRKQYVEIAVYDPDAVRPDDDPNKEKPKVIVTSASDSGNSRSEVTLADENGTYELLGTFEVTGYCPCVMCCGKTDGITAAGTKATAGRTIAAPPRFPFGTKIRIGNQIYIVEDRGGLIQDNCIDMFFNTHEEAMIWGRRKIDVYLVK